MGFREKVTLSLVIVIFLQITCRQCMPSNPRKSTINGYPNNYKPTNPKPSLYSPTQASKPKQSTFGKPTAKAYNLLPNKSLQKTYNFPENEYPLDRTPKDSYNFGKNYNAYKVNTPTKNNLPTDINNLKKEMKMKRKLNNRPMNLETYMNNEMSSTLNKFTSDNQPRVLGPANFPDVQYPTNAMETWGPNYWSFLPPTQNEQKAINPKLFEYNRKPTRPKKPQANRYLQTFEKLKEEREYAKASSKRSNPGDKGLNFTKTATSEKNFEDIITTSLLSSNTTNKNVQSTDLKTIQTAEVDRANSTASDPSGNLSNDTHNVAIESTISTFNDINNDVPLSGDTPTATNGANSSVDEPTDKFIIPITNDANDPNIIITSGSVQNNIPSTVSQSSDNAKNNNNGPLNVKMPMYGNSISKIDLSDIITLSANYTGSSSNANAGSGNSIIIIPLSHGANNPQLDLPIVLYLPTNTSPRDTPVPNYSNNNSTETMSDISNNTTLSRCLNITQTFVDNPTANAFVSELPLLNGASSNYDSKSGPQLPIFETLPRNSMCYNNANSPSSFVEDSSLSNPISQKIISNLQSKIPAYGTINEVQPKEQDTKTEDQSPQDLPVFNFPFSDLTLLSDDINKLQNEEFSKTVREISLDTFKPNKDLTDNLISSTDKIHKETKGKASTSKTSLEPAEPKNLVNKSVLVKDAIKNATMTLFSTDEPSQAVYDAVLKVLLSNATIKSMLSNEKHPAKYIPQGNNTKDGTEVKSDLVDEIILPNTPSNITTTKTLTQPVNQLSMPGQKLNISNETDTKKITIPVQSALLPILPSEDDGTIRSSELKDETMATNVWNNTDTNNITYAKDFSRIPVNETLVTNTNSNTDLLDAKANLFDSKINSSSVDVVRQSEPVLLVNSIIPADNIKKPNTTQLPDISSDIAMDSRSQLIKNEMQKSYDKVVNQRNITDISDPPDILSDDQGTNRDNLSLQPKTEINNGVLSLPLNAQDDKAIDDSEDPAQSEDDLSQPIDQEIVKPLSNISNDLSITLDTIQELDEPVLTVFDNPYIPLDKQPLLEKYFLPTDDPIINSDLPASSDSKVPMTKEEQNSLPETIIESSPDLTIDSLMSSDNEPPENAKSSEFHIVSYGDQRHSGIDTSNDSNSSLEDDWSQPMDEILHNITLLENYSNNLMSSNANLTSQSDIIHTKAPSDTTADLISSFDPIIINPPKSKVGSPSANSIPNGSKSLEKIPQTSKIKEDLSGFDYKTQQVDLNLKTKKRQLPASNRALLNIVDLLDHTVEEDENNESLDPETSIEDSGHFTAMKSHVPMSLPMAKAILEDVLFNIYNGLSIPTPKAERKKKQSKTPAKRI